MTPSWWSKVEDDAHPILQGFTDKLRKKLSVHPRKIVERKNPFLFRIRVENDANEFARMVVDAYLSSSEETMFGIVLEQIAISICKNAIGGWKSSAEKIDLEYEKDSSRCVVQIKSGENWGNSSQKKAMRESFKQARKILSLGDPSIQIKCIEGICYGKSRVVYNGDHYKFVGNKFWTEISGWDGTSGAVFDLIGKHASNGLSRPRSEACNRLVLYLMDNNAIVDEPRNRKVAKQGDFRIAWNRLLEIVLQ